MLSPTKLTLLIACLALFVNIGCDMMPDEGLLVNPEPELTETLIIGPYTEACFGPFPQECYLSFDAARQEWSFFYEGIEDFDYEPGFIYTLKVSLHDRGEGVQDVGRYAYKLIEVLSKVAAPVDERPPAIP